MQIFDYISLAEFYHNVKLKLSSFPSSHVLLTWQVLSENFSDLRSWSQPSIRELTICGNWRVIINILISRWEMSAQRELLLLNRRASFDCGLDEEFDIGQYSETHIVSYTYLHIQSEHSLTTDWRSVARTRRLPLRPWDRATERDMANRCQGAPQIAGQFCSR